VPGRLTAASAPATGCRWEGDGRTSPIHSDRAGRWALSVKVLERRLYTVPEAARLLRVPPSTLTWWLEGRQQNGEQVYPPVIRAEPMGSRDVSWGEFVEAGYLREYRKKNVPLQQLRPVIDRLRREFGVPYPLAHFKPFVAEGRRLVLATEDDVGLPSELRMVVALKTGELLLTPPAESFLERVDFSSEGEQWAERFFPAGRESRVVIDPDRAFGAPTVRGIRTEALAELVDAGEPLDAVNEDFDLEVTDLKAALAYEWFPAA